MTIDQLAKLLFDATAVAEAGPLPSDLSQESIAKALTEEPKLAAFFNEFGRQYAAAQ